LVRPGAIAKEDAVNLFVLFVIVEILVLLGLTQAAKKSLKRTRPIYATS
jgi:hypothetical protein